MSSECYWCKKGEPQIEEELGTANHPLGCCKKCHVLSCGHHAQRDPFRKEFFCFDCDTSIIIKSADKKLLDDEIDVNKITKDIVEKFNLREGYKIEYSIIEDDELFYSYDDFKKRRPQYKNLFDEIENIQNNFSWGTELTHYFISIPIEAKLLYIAAGVIMSKTLSIDHEQLYPYFMTQIKNAIQNRGGTQWQEATT